MMKIKHSIVERGWQAICFAIYVLMMGHVCEKGSISVDKKYALPYRVVDSVVHHFLGFRSDKRDLPVLWHQALLTFCQRYKQDVSLEQKEALLDICKIHNHPKITPEVRRELTHSRARDEEVGSMEM